ncbi:MAG: hypothetical protein V4539_00030 [Bacteroidota bacterium]
MKHILFPVYMAIFTLCLFSCKKDDAVTEVEPITINSAADLNGKWELRFIAGNIAGGKTFAPGNGNLFIFNNGQYESYKNGQLTIKGVFTIMSDTTVAESVCLNIKPGAYANRIVYDGNLTKPKSFFEIRGGKLEFISGCFAGDAGHSETYENIK